MHADVRVPRTPAFDADYWLCRCEGFRVESPAGRVGFVEGVRFASRLDRPDILAVRTGLLRRRVLLVPVEEVAELVPRDGRLILRGTPRSGGLGSLSVVWRALAPQRGRAKGGGGR